MLHKIEPSERLVLDLLFTTVRLPLLEAAFTLISKSIIQRHEADGFLLFNGYDRGHLQKRDPLKGISTSRNI